MSAEDAMTVTEDECVFDERYYDVAIVMNDCYDVGGMGVAFLHTTCENGALKTDMYSEDGCTGTPTEENISSMFDERPTPEPKEGTPEPKEPKSAEEGEEGSPESKEAKSAEEGSPESKE